MNCYICGVQTESSDICELHKNILNSAEKNSDKYFEVRNRVKEKQKDKSAHMEKYGVRYETRKLIKKGEIERKSCEVCGDPKAEVHHVTYDVADNVRFLCKKHHMDEHYPNRVLVRQS